MNNDPPLRCQSCSRVIVKKPKAKTPKNCPQCREKQQDSYRAQLKAHRRRKVR